MPTAEPLTATQRSVLLATLAPFADVIERVDIYGSRARGTHRPGSDVDLVMAGALDWETVAKISRAIEESQLSIFADVTGYSLLADDPYRDELLRTARPLFTRDELIARQGAGPGAAAGL